MYSKTRNTLTALSAASLFVVAGWAFGHPMQPAPSLPAQHLQLSISDSSTQMLNSIQESHQSRMSLGMPYFSFALSLPQRRAD